MQTLSLIREPAAVSSPAERLLTAALVVAPLVYLAADATYAARGWDDGTAGVVHVLGATLYGLVFVRVATWLPATSWLAAAILLVGMAGTAGNVAYGFEAIHMSVGDLQLTERSGAATLIKPLGLCFPAALLLVAWTLRRLGRSEQAWVVGLAAVAWPVAHIANLASVAVAVDVALVLGLGSLAWVRADVPADAGGQR